MDSRARAAARLLRSSDFVLPPPKQRGFHGRRVSAERNALAYARLRLAKPRIQAGNGGAECAGTSVDEGGGEKRVAHLLSQREQRDAHAGLRLGQLRAFDVDSRLNRRVVHALLDAERRVVGVLGRQEQRLATRQERRRRRDVGLELNLPFDRDRRFSLGGDVAQPQIGLCLLQRDLGETRIGGDGRLLQRRELQAL